MFVHRKRSLSLFYGAAAIVGGMYYFLKCTETCTGRQLPCNPEASNANAPSHKTFSKCMELCVGYVKLWLAASSPFGSLATAAGGAAGKKISGY